MDEEDAAYIPSHHHNYSVGTVFGERPIAVRTSGTNHPSSIGLLEQSPLPDNDQRGHGSSSSDRIRGDVSLFPHLPQPSPAAFTITPTGPQGSGQGGDPERRKAGRGKVRSSRKPKTAAAATNPITTAGKINEDATATATVVATPPMDNYSSTGASTHHSTHSTSIGSGNGLFLPHDATGYHHRFPPPSASSSSFSSSTSSPSSSHAPFHNIDWTKGFASPAGIGTTYFVPSPHPSSYPPAPTNLYHNPILLSNIGMDMTSTRQLNTGPPLDPSTTSQQQPHNRKDDDDDDDDDEEEDEEDSGTYETPTVTPTPSSSSTGLRNYADLSKHDIERTIQIGPVRKFKEHLEQLNLTKEAKLKIKKKRRDYKNRTSAKQRTQKKKIENASLKEENANLKRELQEKNEIINDLMNTMKNYSTMAIGQPHPNHPQQLRQLHQTPHFPGIESLMHHHQHNPHPSSQPEPMLQLPGPSSNLPTTSYHGNSSAEEDYPTSY